MTTEDEARCVRCRRAIPIASDELGSWELIVDDQWCCEGCLTPSEWAAIDEAEREAADSVRCSRCGASPEDAASAEEVDAWIEDDASTICPSCQTHEDRMVDFLRLEMALEDMKKPRDRRQQA